MRDACGRGRCRGSGGCGVCIGAYREPRGLGVLGSTDRPDIREALLGRVADPDIDVREEAVVGLAKRQDVRVLPALLPMLGDSFSGRVAEAASLMAGVEFEEDRSGKEYIALISERCPQTR